MNKLPAPFTGMISLDPPACPVILIVVYGAPGSGKTTLCETLLHKEYPATHDFHGGFSERNDEGEAELRYWKCDHVDVLGSPVTRVVSYICNATNCDDGRTPSCNFGSRESQQSGTNRNCRKQYNPLFEALHEALLTQQSAGTVVGRKDVRHNIAPKEHGSASYGATVVHADSREIKQERQGGIRSYGAARCCTQIDMFYVCSDTVERISNKNQTSFTRTFSRNAPTTTYLQKGLRRSMSSEDVSTKSEDCTSRPHFDPKTWADSRQQVYTTVERIFHDIRKKQNPNTALGRLLDSHTGSCCLSHLRCCTEIVKGYVIVVEDTFHLSSMRKAYFQLARKRKLALHA
eukprot:GHVQ01014558.1.p1 GENE.GHVQ01014558.1~~GHVQ01014558.1.p1  ORF type:complete len:346 (+),score=31.63 GHVQ01014558.1:2570-3607(+)